MALYKCVVIRCKYYSPCNYIPLSTANKQLAIMARITVGNIVTYLNNEQTLCSELLHEHRQLQASLESTHNKNRVSGTSTATVGPGKPHNLIPYAPIKMPKLSRGRKHGKGCPLTIRLGVGGSVVSSHSGVRDMDFMHI